MSVKLGEVQLDRKYNIGLKTAQSLVSKLDIFHPYGQVGKLPWQGGGEGPSIEYGNDELVGNQLFELSKQILTFTEASTQTVNSDQLHDIQNAIHFSDKVIFLGFAFHRLNVELLLPTSRTGEKVRKYFYTPIGNSNSSLEMINETLKSFCPSYDDACFIETPYFDATVKDSSRGTCSDLFDECGISIFHNTWEANE